MVKGKPYFGVEEKYDDILAGSTIEVIVPNQSEFDRRTSHCPTRSQFGAHN